MTEFEFFDLSNWNSNRFAFLRVCRHMLNASLMISDTGCHNPPPLKKSHPGIMSGGALRSKDA
jgi:hypothetical protein